MNRLQRRSSWLERVLAIGASLGVFVLMGGGGSAENAEPGSAAKDDYGTVVKPLMKKYCLECHSTAHKKGSLDLERFGSVDQVRKSLKRWEQVIEMLEASQMPPENKPQPTSEERQQLVSWIRGFLDAEALARAGDPGNVPLRRLSNAEYDCTIRDLTGVDLRPTREFPADGAAGEGFTNAVGALTDISPALLTKYLNAAKEVSEHAVLLPDGFRFSPSKTRRDWTDESLAAIRKFYANFSSDGRLPVQPYLAATVRHREALESGKMTLLEVARKEQLNLRYLEILWQALTDQTRSYPLDSIRARWRQANESDVVALAADIGAWQALLWQVVPVGSYRYGNTVRQVANNAACTETVPLRIAVKPLPGQSDIVVYLVTRDLFPQGKEGSIVWHRPRFESNGKPPLLLRDYPEFGPAYEIDYSAVFSNCAKYLAAAAEAAHDRKLNASELANKHGLDAALLRRWIEVLAVEPLNKDAADPEKLGKKVPTVPLEVLDEKILQSDKKPAINGWRRMGKELPILLTNSSDTAELVPGKMSPHKVAVHPTPKEFVAVTWKSPVAGSIRVAARVAHVHPACGNGVAWWLEHRRSDRATVLADGALDLGAEVKTPEKAFKIEKGDLLILAVDAKNGDHSCDLTEIALTICEADKPGRVWDLAADIANTVLDGNPHADNYGNEGVWSFVLGPSKPTAPVSGASIPTNSVLGRWRELAMDPARQADAAKLADQVQNVLTSSRPAKEKDPDRIAYDNLVSGQGALLKGLDLTRFTRPRSKGPAYGVDKNRFGRQINDDPGDDASLIMPANTVTEVRLPAALFYDHEFVVEGKLDVAAGDRVVQFQLLTVPPQPELGWDGKSPVVASPTGAGYKHLLEGFADFRRCFPMFICFPRVIPDDEVVCLKMYHREDEPLAQLFLNAEQKVLIDRLWDEHRFISQQPVAENNYLPQFIGFVTQDQPKELLAYFEGQRDAFRKRAEAFEKELEAAGPKQLEALVSFAGRAYRRPLLDREKSELLGLYDTIRKKGVSHDEAFRAVLSRVLVSPAFLFRIEKAPAGKEPAPVSDWELATRLSYFLWSSTPDEELRRLTRVGRLREPSVLAEQTRRMIKDDHVRALAVEFGTQWIHVRGFDELKEKNEKLFPMFDAGMRQAIYEESILFFQDLFQSDRTVTDVLDADFTFLNETLAKHYGIPGVTGPQWRRVTGVRKYGRGGILGLASVQAKQAGASRTSPVLRGNWVVETLLGEKLPRPPANVPRLPEEEGGADRLTMRQQVEKHARVKECAVCHQRMDPFGFALERYDPIGRRRDRDLGGLVVDSRAKLKDGTEFEDIDGLRNYLLTKKKQVVVRLFCRKLLGYALGRAVTLSDTALLDEMMAELQKNDGRLSAAVLAIVRSPQFRMIRGSDYVE